LHLRLLPHRRILAVLLAAALCAGAAPAVSEEVADALRTLEQDQREGVEKALSVLVADANRESFEAIANFGARTLFNRHSILAGAALAQAGDTIAAAEIARLLRANKRQPEALARVALMAEQIPGDTGTRFLLSLVKEKRERVAINAIRGLGARREEKARSALMGLLKTSKRPLVASAAGFALSRLAPEKATMELLFNRAQKTTKERVGDACGLALTRMEGAEEYGNRALALLLGRSSSDTFHALVKVALRLATKPDPELLDRGLQSPSPEVREVCCDLIGLRKVPGFQEKLLRIATSDGNWRNAVAGWLALKRCGIDQVVDAIRSNIGRTGEAAYWAIQCAQCHPDASLLPALRDAALDTKDPVRRELAQRALRAATQEHKETREFYVETARRLRGTAKAQAALLGLGNLQDQDAFHALVAILEQEKDERYQLWIVKGLEKLTGHYYEPNPEIWKEWFKVVEGEVAYTPKPIDRKKNRERVTQVRDLGISPATEGAVENGLLWLKRHQDLSGGWNGSTYSENCWAGECAKEGGIRERDLAYTGLAILAYQGAGYSHLDGPYRDVVQRGFEYILANQDYDGSHHEKSWTFSYESAILCQALCDGYALTGDPWLGDGAQRMIDYLVKIQYPGRTWRYRVRSTETDTSVMSWILTACIAARAAGIDIPEQIYVASEVWLDTASDPVPKGEFEVFVPDLFSKKNTYFIDISKDKRGKARTFKIKTWYQPPRLYTPAMSAIGMVARIWMGWTRAHPFCIGSANQVASQIPGYGKGLEGEFAFYPYTWYYGSLAMYQMGGRYWQRWREECIADLLKNQQLSGCMHGSWLMPRGQLVAGLTGGTVYCTAMSILTLETFYRYQPYLARHELRSREDPEEAKADEGKGDKKPDDAAGGAKSPEPGG